MNKFCKECGECGVGEEDDLHEKCAPKYLEHKMATPSKEPSVQLTVRKLLMGLGEWCYRHGVRKADPKEADKEIREIQAQLLALHLGCLPEKLGDSYKYRKSDEEMQAHNSAVDLMEQKLPYALDLSQKKV